jgi:hypothetical protein
MTGATKVDKFHGTEGSRIENCPNPGFELLGPHRPNMTRSGAVASLAGNSWRRVVRIKLPPNRRFGCVTGKTLLRGFIALRRSECAFQELWRTAGMFGRNIDAADRLKIAELTLEEYSQVTENEGLTFDSRAHRPEKLSADRFAAS